MFDSPHSPDYSNRLWTVSRQRPDSSSPQNPSTLRTKWESFTALRVGKLWRFRASDLYRSGPKVLRGPRRRRSGTVGWNQPLVPVTREEINPCLFGHGINMEVCG